MRAHAEVLECSLACKCFYVPCCKAMRILQAGFFQRWFSSNATHPKLGASGQNMLHDYINVLSSVKLVNDSGSQIVTVLNVASSSCIVRMTCQK